MKNETRRNMERYGPPLVFALVVALMLVLFGGGISIVVSVLHEESQCREACAPHPGVIDQYGDDCLCAVALEKPSVELEVSP